MSMQDQKGSGRYSQQGQGGQDLGRQQGQQDGSGREQGQQGGIGRQQGQHSGTQGERKQGGSQGHPGERAQARSAEDLRVSGDQPGRQQQAGGDSAGQQSQQGVYGEGNYQATRDYNRRTRDFIDSGKVEQAARDAAPDSEAEAQQMAAAEAEGKRHIKEEDPALARKASDRNAGTTSGKPGKEG